MAGDWWVTQMTWLQVTVSSRISIMAMYKLPTAHQSRPLEDKGRREEGRETFQQSTLLQNESVIDPSGPVMSLNCCTMLQVGHMELWAGLSSYRRTGSQMSTWESVALGERHSTTKHLSDSSAVGDEIQRQISHPGCVSGWHELGTPSSAQRACIAARFPEGGFNF